MALLLEPTITLSEHSSIKNRLIGARRRGAIINIDRQKTGSKPKLRGRHRGQAHPGD